jgi:hypothetical protein
MTYIPAGQVPPGWGSRPEYADQVSPYSTGWEEWVTFAGVMGIILGIFNAIEGLTALASEEVFLVSEEDLLVLDFVSWGWILLIVGLVQLLAGIGILRAQTWARVVGVIFAGLNAISHVVFTSAHPFWSILIIFVDILVIFALTAHGREVAQRR